MMNSLLPRILSSLHTGIEARLKAARESFDHSGAKGDASEGIWRDLLQAYLPARYQVTKGHVVDSRGACSDQIDVIVFDRQYTPFIFQCEGNYYLPAESVYAVLEAKQTIDAQNIAYARTKAASVRRLYRTSLPIPHAGGTYQPKAHNHIIGGVLAFESNWNPPLGKKLLEALDCRSSDDRLDIGCVAANGCFSFNESTEEYDLYCGGASVTSFLFKLISQLQFCGTVPMVDVLAYAKWIPETKEV